MSMKLNIIIYILAGVIVLLAVFLLKTVLGGNTQPPNTINSSSPVTTNSNQQASQTNPQSNTQSGQPQTLTWKQSLSADEQAIYNTPNAQSSAEEKSKHASLVLKLSQTSDMIHIANNCRPYPLVYSVKNFSVKFVNDDTVEHTIILGKNQSYTLAPKASQTITIQKDKANTISGYGCDTFSPVGFLVIGPS